MTDQSSDISRAERLARVEADLKNLNENMHSVQNDIREVRDSLREMHGGGKTILTILAIAGSVGTLVSILYNKMFHS